MSRRYSVLMMPLQRLQIPYNSFVNRAHWEEKLEELYARNE